MDCYCCAEKGIERSAVALCRSCSAGLCMEHLHDTATRFASGHILDTCHHDTWTARPAVVPHPATPEAS